METALPTPYVELNSVLQDLVDRVQAVLGNNFVGAYLQGSFASGDFDLHSDVDFVIVIEEDPSPLEVHGLQEAHGRIYRLASPWAQHLEGSYFPKIVLQDYARCGAQLWYLDHGSCSLILSDHCNTVLVRRVVRAQGVTLAGPAPALLVDPIPVEVLRKHIRVTIEHWGQEILSRPGPFNNRFYQGFIVLNYCRMLHDLHQGRPGSKLAGAHWAKAHLAADFHGLIERAWHGRPDPAVSVQEVADARDFQETLEFIRYCRNQAQMYQQ
ncbi:MAG TPA: aminoglycoside adenylyltransferase domain-containing protein [Ktedonobacteraceae bacterium]